MQYTCGVCCEQSNKKTEYIRRTELVQLPNKAIYPLIQEICTDRVGCINRLAYQVDERSTVHVHGLAYGVPELGIDNATDIRNTAEYQLHH